MTSLLTIFAVAGVKASVDLHWNSQGSLRVVVVDEQGRLVPEAPVYLADGHNGQFIGMAPHDPTLPWVLPAGLYRVSSARLLQEGEHIDRYASREALVAVMPGDQASVVLTLRGIPPFHRPPSYQTLVRHGIDPARSSPF